MSIDPGDYVENANLGLVGSAARPHFLDVNARVNHDGPDQGRGLCENAGVIDADATHISRRIGSDDLAAHVVLDQRR